MSQYEEIKQAIEEEPTYVQAIRWRYRCVLLLKALELTVMFIDDELKDFRRPETDLDYWLEQAKKSFTNLKH